MTQPGVLLAEDNPAVSHQLRALLAQDFDIVAAVMDGMEMVTRARAISPDAIVTDISLPGMDGLSAAELLCRERPELRVVFITVHDDVSLVERAMRLGDCGYVIKADAGEDLIPAVHSVLGGVRFCSRSVRRHGNAAT